VRYSPTGTNVARSVTRIVRIRDDVDVNAGYSGTPLPKKLGLRAGSRVLLVGAPRDFILSPLPPGAVLHRRRVRADYDIVLLFAADLRGLVAGFTPAATATVINGAVWVCWPKRASGVATDLDENAVREHGLSGGLVDVKVAAVDGTWSGLKFVRRLRDR
jgi:hypothetical protein